jgi:hypothetical protein
MKRILLSQNAEIYYKAQYTIDVNHPKKTLKGIFTASQGGLSRSSPHRTDGSQDSLTGGWAL